MFAFLFGLLSAAFWFWSASLNVQAINLDSVEQLDLKKVRWINTAAAVLAAFAALSIAIHQ
jgi:hypothetical protein